MTPAPRRIAVVGSGVAGLTAAYVASRTADVTLFEADDRLGGHADTHVVASPDGSSRIDTGFIVHNARTYPTLLRLFAELGVATQPSEMSLSVRDDGHRAGVGRRPRGPRACSRRSATCARPLPGGCSPRSRGSTGGREPARSPAHGATTTTSSRPCASSSTTGGFSAYFARHFMEPLVAAVWSCDPEVALDYPARYLFTFLEHHGMLGVFGSPQWRTVTGGSREYVAAVAAGLQEVRTGTKVTSVLETDDGVEVTDGNGEVHSYDAVVIATHPGQALAMLAEPTAAQREVLGAMPYSPNTALLHTDTSLLPGPTTRASAGTSSARRRRPAT